MSDRQLTLERWSHAHACPNCGDTFRSKRGLLRHWCRGKTRWF